MQEEVELRVLALAESLSMVLAQLSSRPMGADIAPPPAYERDPSDDLDPHEKLRVDVLRGAYGSSAGLLANVEPRGGRSGGASSSSGAHGRAHPSAAASNAAGAAGRAASSSSIPPQTLANGAGANGAGAASSARGAVQSTPSLPAMPRARGMDYSSSPAAAAPPAAMPSSALGQGHGQGSGSGAGVVIREPVESNVSNLPHRIAAAAPPAERLRECARRLRETLASVSAHTELEARAERLRAESRALDDCSVALARELRGVQLSLTEAVAAGERAINAGASAAEAGADPSALVRYAMMIAGTSSYPPCAGTATYGHEPPAPQHGTQPMFDTVLHTQGAEEIKPVIDVKRDGDGSDDAGSDEEGLDVTALAGRVTSRFVDSAQDQVYDPSRGADGADDDEDFSDSDFSMDDSDFE